MISESKYGKIIYNLGTYWVILNILLTVMKLREQNKVVLHDASRQATVYCLFLCIVCVQMCTVLLPPGVNPIAVNKYIYL